MGKLYLRDITNDPDMWLKLGPGSAWSTNSTVTFQDWVDAVVFAEMNRSNANATSYDHLVGTFANLEQRYRENRYAEQYL